MFYSLSSLLLLVKCRQIDNKYSNFICLSISGIYCIQNIITAVVYRAFRGYFLNSIINSQLRRRTAVRASFEVLRKRVSFGGFIETK
jgi:hypothetical protein